MERLCCSAPFFVYGILSPTCLVPCLSSAAGARSKTMGGCMGAYSSVQVAAFTNKVVPSVAVPCPMCRCPVTTTGILRFWMAASKSASPFRPTGVMSTYPAGGPCTTYAELRPLAKMIISAFSLGFKEPKIYNCI